MLSFVVIRTITECVAVPPAWTSSSIKRDGYISGGSISAVSGAAILEPLTLSCGARSDWNNRGLCHRASVHLNLVAEASIHEEPGEGKPHAGIGGCRVTGSPAALNSL